jgi:hypothetical protein
MSGSAWFWLIFILIVYLVIPIALFCYHPDRSGEVTDEWGAVPYENLKFSKIKEMIIVIGVCSSFSWVVWLLIKLKVLVWK